MLAQQQRLASRAGATGSRPAFVAARASRSRTSSVRVAAMKVGESLKDSAEYYRVLKTSDNKTVSLASFEGKPLVLFFYPKAATPGCTKEACKFRDEYDAFVKAGAQVFGISSDAPADNKAFADAQRLPFPLLTDPSSIMRKTFGIKGDLLGLLPGRQTFVFNAAGKRALGAGVAPGPEICSRRVRELSRQPPAWHGLMSAPARAHALRAPAAPAMSLRPGALLLPRLLRAHGRRAATRSGSCAWPAARGVAPGASGAAPAGAAAPLLPLAHGALRGPQRASFAARAASAEPAVEAGAALAAPPSDVEAPAAVETVVLDVGGMKCGGCSAAVKSMLAKHPGVQGAAVNLLTETAAVTVRAGEAGTVSAAAEMLTKKGFPAKLRAPEADGALASDEADARRAEEARASLVNLGLAWALVLLCCSHHLGHLLHALGYHQFAHTPFMALMGQPAVSGALGAFALLGPGRTLLVDGLRSLWGGAPNMNSLVAIGSTTSFAVGAAAAALPGLGFDSSFLEEPVMLLAFVLLGRALEARAKVRAASDLKALAKLIPASSRLVLDPSGAKPAAAAAGAAGGGGVAEGVELVLVPTSSVRPGDILRVLPGERVPCDGEVLDGVAAVDEAMLTGESVLVAKRAGAGVAGGTVVYEGPLTIRATATGAESTLAGIGRLVAAAQAREAPVQRVADAVAGKFCYGVMAASAATFGFWQLLGTQLFPAALTASGSPSALLLSIRLAVDVLVVACPCALGLATPTAVLVGSSLGATRGLLMRGGDVLERVAGITGVVFDKTGTLTEGRLRLAGLALAPGAADAVAAALDGGGGGGAGAGGDGEALLLRVAAAVEANTRHPLAAALAAEAAARGLKLPAANEARTEPGSGVAAVIGGQPVLVGRPEWVLGQLPEAQRAAAAQLAPPGEPGGARGTQVLVAVGPRLLGGLSFRDALRPDAARTVAALQGMGLRVFLLSGDDDATVQAVAAAAGIAPGDAFGSNSPQDKLAVITRLQAEGMRLAMVGDGVNDAPALAAADVGIALSGGLDAAGEAASVVLMGDRLGQVVDCVRLGQATLAKIRQNLAWALVYNVVGIPLAAGALLPSLGLALNPSAAGGMMAFSSVAVVSNSLLLRAQYGRGGGAARAAGGGGDAAGAGELGGAGAAAGRVGEPAQARFQMPGGDGGGEPVPAVPAAGGGSDPGDVLIDLGPDDPQLQLPGGLRQQEYWLAASVEPADAAALRELRGSAAADDAEEADDSSDDGGGSPTKQRLLAGARARELSRSTSVPAGGRASAAPPCGGAKAAPAQRWRSAAQAVVRLHRATAGLKPHVGLQGLDVKRHNYDSLLRPLLDCEVQITVADYNQEQVKVVDGVRNDSLAAFLQQPRPPWSRVRWINVQEYLYASVIMVSVGEPSTITPAAGAALGPAALDGGWRGAPPPPAAAPPARDRRGMPKLRRRLAPREVGGSAAAPTALGAASAGSSASCGSLRPMELGIEQASLFLFRDGTVISMFSSEGEGVAHGILERLRGFKTLLTDSENASFLFNSLLDAVVDHTLPVVQVYSSRIAALESQVLLNKRPPAALTKELHLLGNDLKVLRRTLVPTQHLIHKLQSGHAARDSTQFLTPLTALYLSDVLDHVSTLCEDLDVLAEDTKALIDLIFNTVSHANNSSMQLLAVVSCLFLPITFLAGVYGTNFTQFPEIHWEYGYLYFWTSCCVVTVAFSLWLRRCGMFSS
ncbi:PAA2 [Scenedesmus sp. PABB004]|nr:PAA2 [Scenedesmus sp. PABB004]